MVQDLNIYYKDNVTRFMGPDVTQPNRRLYRSRFTEHKIWLYLLRSVITTFGATSLTGLMAHFRIEDRLV